MIDDIVLHSGCFHDGGDRRRFTCLASQAVSKTDEVCCGHGTRPRNLFVAQREFPPAFPYQLVKLVVSAFMLGECSVGPDEKDFVHSINR